MIDYHYYKSRFLYEMLSQWQQLNINSHPLDWTWMFYAYLKCASVDNTTIEYGINLLKQWGLADSTTIEGNIGALGLATFIFRKRNLVEENIFLEKLTKLSTEVLNKSQGKFSPINDPFIFYCFTLGIQDNISDEQVSQLISISQRNSEFGSNKRQLLYFASLVELGKTVPTQLFSVADIDLGELPVYLWISEYYPSILTEQTRRDLWDCLPKLINQITVETADESMHAIQREVGAFDLSLLYMAISQKAGTFDPIAQYNNHPLHPAIRRASESLFLKGEYVNAVLEASKTFIDEIKKKSSNPIGGNGKPLDGRSLVQSVFSTKNPIIKFNNLISQSEVDEHEGLKLIAEGIIAAIRNPKGHDPKEKITLPPDEALDQLVVVSYLHKRLDQAIEKY